MNDENLKDNAAPPDRLTRFYGNPDYALETIASKQITFVHASLLNDPFDPHFFLETDFGECYEKLLDYIQKTHPAKLSWFKQQMPPANWALTMKQLKDKLASIRNGLFVFSTIGLQDDLEAVSK
jgi:hypothetical protein